MDEGTGARIAPALRHRKADVPALPPVIHVFPQLSDPSGRLF